MCLAQGPQCINAGEARTRGLSHAGRGTINIKHIKCDFRSRPVSHPLGRRRGWVQIQLFQNMVMLHIKLKGITNAAACIKYFVLKPLPTPHLLTLGLGSKGQNSTFSEHGHGAYQNKGNHECSNMVAIIFPTDPPAPTWEIGSIGQNSTFTEHGHVAYQIKGNDDMQQYGSSQQTPTPPTTLGLRG